MAEKDAVCEDHEEFGNIKSAFTTEQLFQRRKKNESASQAQQAFSVSVLYFSFLKKLLLFVVLSLMISASCPSCQVVSWDLMKITNDAQSQGLFKLSSLNWPCIIHCFRTVFVNSVCSNSFAS